MQMLTSIRLISGLTLCIATGVAGSADDFPTGVVRITPAEVKWKPGATPGVERADLIGDRGQAGAYVFRARFPGNWTDPAHSHPDSRTYTILSGTWYVGFGDKFDDTKLKPLPAGSFYTEPANVNHFVATKDEPVIVQISGTGPSPSVFVNPANDPKNKK
jgi:mannose-6-phosphate isomerase-like protein (cupin superfamily)